MCTYFIPLIILIYSSHHGTGARLVLARATWASSLSVEADILISV